MKSAKGFRLAEVLSVFCNIQLYTYQTHNLDEGAELV